MFEQSVEIIAVVVSEHSKLIKQKNKQKFTDCYHYYRKHFVRWATNEHVLCLFLTHYVYLHKGIHLNR